MSNQSDQNRQDRWLYEYDFQSLDKETVRPDYTRLFAVLDDAGIHKAADFNLIGIEGHRKLRLSHPVRSIVGDTIRQSVAWVSHPKNEVHSPQLRILSDAPNAELLFLTNLLSNNLVIISDSDVHFWSTEIPNPVHAVYWEGLLDQMFLCKESLIKGRTVLCPAIVRRTVGRGDDIDASYSLDFASSLNYRDKAFFRLISATSRTDLRHAPEDLTRAAPATRRHLPAAVPLLKVNLPILRGVDTKKLQSILDEEDSALKRLRFILKELGVGSDETLLTPQRLQDIAERIEYEVARLDEDYRKLLRRREQTLAKAATGIVGLVISLSLPHDMAPLAQALGAAAAGMNSLKYVFSIRDSKADLRRNDFYLAWKAWHESA